MKWSLKEKNQQNTAIIVLVLPKKRVLSVLMVNLILKFKQNEKPFKLDLFFFVAVVGLCFFFFCMEGVSLVTENLVVFIVRCSLAICTVHYTSSGRNKESEKEKKKLFGLYKVCTHLKVCNFRKKTAYTCLLLVFQPKT